MFEDLQASGWLKAAVRLALFVALFSWSATQAAAQDVNAQDAPQAQTQSATSAQEDQDESAGAESALEPLLKDYKGVTIGMSAAEARRKLGNSDADGKTSDFFQISDNEMAQLFYDQEGKVRAISVIHTGSGAPQPKSVLGEDVEPGSDGRAYKLIRYPKAGYWVAYSRTAGNSPLVTVTIQRMRTAAANTKN